MYRLFVACALVLSLAACGPNGAAPKTSEASAAEAKAFLEKNANEPGVVTLPSGLQYKVLKSGPTDGPHPGPRDEVLSHYEGTFLNGEVFDSSYERGNPAVFRPDRVVPGWTEALQLMRPGDEWMLYLPPELGYGADGGGRVPPNSVLTFRLELLAVRKS